MTPEEFRRRGHELIDWIADYVEGLESGRSPRTVAPGRRPPAAAGPPADVAGDRGTP